MSQKPYPARAVRRAAVLAPAAVWLDAGIELAWLGSAGVLWGLLRVLDRLLL